MFEDVGSEISAYLTTGMHHCTKEAQAQIREIVEKYVVKEFKKHTPTEFSTKLHQLSPSASDFSI